MAAPSDPSAGQPANSLHEGEGQELPASSLLRSRSGPRCADGDDRVGLPGGDRRPSRRAIGLVDQVPSDRPRAAPRGRSDLVAQPAEQCASVAWVVNDADERLVEHDQSGCPAALSIRTRCCCPRTGAQGFGPLVGEPHALSASAVAARSAARPGRTAAAATAGSPPPHRRCVQGDVGPLRHVPRDHCGPRQGSAECRRRPAGGRRPSEARMRVDLLPLPPISATISPGATVRRRLAIGMPPTRRSGR
jgi:hypothetical protein